MAAGWILALSLKLTTKEERVGSRCGVVRWNARRPADGAHGGAFDGRPMRSFFLPGIQRCRSTWATCGGRAFAPRQPLAARKQSTEAVSVKRSAGLME